MRKYVIAAATTLVLIAAAVTASPIPPLNAMYGSKAGTDANDNLWFWNYQSQTITQISPAGEVVTSGVLSDTATVDFDATRGLATLSGAGNRLRILTSGGTTIKEIPLPEAAGDIAWLRGPLIAVTPKYAGHRIAVWDTVSSTLVRTIDPCLPIPDDRGTHIARATLVRYDAEKDEIVALDSTFGRLFLFRSTGEVVRDLRLPVEPTPIAQWLSDSRNYEHPRHMIEIWRFPTVSIARDGVIWISGGMNANGLVSAFRYDRDGRVETVTIDVPTCRTSRLQPWQDALVLFRDPQLHASTCSAVLTPRSTSPTTFRVEFVTRPLLGDATRKSLARHLKPAPNASMWCNAGAFWCMCECADYNGSGYPLSNMTCSCASATCPPYTVAICSVTCIYTGP